MKKVVVLICIAIVTISMGCKNTREFPITDLHIHLKGNLTIEDAVKKSESENINYGIAFNCGYKFPIHSDIQIDSVVQLMSLRPALTQFLSAHISSFL